MPTARPRLRAGLTAALLALLALGAAAANASAAKEFPRGDERYHTYAEMTARLQAVAKAHPDIVSLSSIGKSYEGRTLWLVKISDDPGVDEPEPEVLITALTHSREHLTVEQALALIGWLVDGYGTNGRIRNIVNSHEIWVIPMLNPDGGEYDIRNGKYHWWRKNRQPNPHTKAIGTDLNRNYDYHWDCCGGSDDNPYSQLYHGPKPFSAVETRAERAFVLGRRVNGHQQLRLILNLHTAGEYVLFPYGYTLAAYPRDMRHADHLALRALARGMAARNGYHALQGSHWYITDGTANDWAYGRQRILSMTMELYPHGGGKRFYPPDERIAGQTARNRGALLWYIEQAACPYAAAGLAAGCSASVAEIDGAPSTDTTDPPDSSDSPDLAGPPAADLVPPRSGPAFVAD